MTAPQPSDPTSKKLTGGDLPPIDTVKGGKSVEYLNVPAVFDIECSSFYDGEEKRAIMYAWVFGINGRCWFGRTWEEFVATLETVSDRYQLDQRHRLIVYVHNLAYEFQFMRKWFNWTKVFAVDRRTPLTAVTDLGIEFRCSYLLTGYSLEKVGQHLHTYHVSKLSGELDYDKIRSPLTPLTHSEWEYIHHDGLVVMAHIQEEIERLGGIHKIPLTNTGYVRTKCREYCYAPDERLKYSRLMKSCRLEPDEFIQLKKTYAGGYTHANARYMGQTLEKVASYDFTSSYPAVMLSEKFPMGKCHHLDHIDLQHALYLMTCKCCMFRIDLENVRSVTEEQYLSVSRCLVSGSRSVNNGRVAFAEGLTAWVTEIDFEIIRRCYRWDRLMISEFKYWGSDYLPRPLLQAVVDLYKAKTELKGVKGSEVEYMNAKGMLNSTYGMCVTDPCKDDIVYHGAWGVEPVDLVTALKDHNGAFNRFLFYPWGVWITAYARRNLWTAIMELKSDYVYSDTDSVKILHHDRHQDYFDRYNKKIKEKVRRCLSSRGFDPTDGEPKTINGTAKPLGVWDFEGVYARFKTLGAKRYITEEDSRIEITVAGVAKRAGADYIVNLGGDPFDHFEEDLYFPPTYIDPMGNERRGSGKLLSTYLDDDKSGEMIDYMGGSYHYDIRSGVHLEPVGYNMGIAEEYQRYLFDTYGG